MRNISLYDLPPPYGLDDRPESKLLKKLAARVGRSLYDKPKYDKFYKALTKYMNTLDTGSLRYWAKVVMIDHRWNGATGQGAFWAVASEAVNEIALSILKSRAQEHTFMIYE